MDATQITKILHDREYELERERTRSLARQQWAKTIEVEARIDECHRVLAHITNLEQPWNKEGNIQTLPKT